MKGNKRTRLIGVLCGMILCCAASDRTFGAELFLQPLTPKVEPALSQRMTQGGRDRSYKVWAFFTDKGLRTLSEYKEEVRRTRARMSRRVIERRVKALPEGKLVDFRDLPVRKEYIDQVLGLGVEIRAVSRWFNGVSLSATRDQIDRLKEIPFVRSVEMVRGLRRREPLQDSSWKLLPQSKIVAAHGIDYGRSYDQLAQIRVPELHDLGYSGRGVRICMLDSGFNYREHEAFSHLNVVAERDFINDDDYVSDEAGQDELDQGKHGVWTLSVIGGYSPRNLIGPAYEAEYLLAKTEDLDSETPVEEDYWIEGIEWADGLGADVVNSSIGYNTWEDGSGYTYLEMNGDVARTTIAADIAASKGIVVVASVGNERDKPWHYVHSPADGDSVIAVGAVDRMGDLATFSSVGPTSDGRIKPDVVAMGVGVYCADPTATDAYVALNGTSFSSPLVAGVCALLLEIHPEWGPVQAADVLRKTARDLGVTGPDSLYGWGLVDAFAASGLSDEIPGGSPIASLGDPFPNPSRGDVHFPLKLSSDVEVSLSIFAISGELVARTPDRLFYVGSHTVPGRALMWDGRNSSGKPVASGVYIYRIESEAFEKSGTVAIVR